MEGLLHSPSWLVGVAKALYSDGVIRIKVRVRKGAQMAAIVRACVPTTINGFDVIVEQV